jgi:LmbE family N-acetylglucosaminyl deacetylase
VAADRSLSRSVLVVAAHPDDEVLGCGATVARRAARGDTVHVVILGEGIASRYARAADADPADVRALQDDARAVGAMLGAKSVAFGGLPDNRFDTVALLDVVKRVEGWVRDLEPEVIYTHHRGDLNVDHRVTLQAVLTATRPVPGCPVKEVYAFEVASSTEWAFQQIAGAFSPTVFEDVAETIELKVRALERYRGEHRAFPHPRSGEALRASARRWGSVAGLPWAEAFELVRSIRGPHERGMVS